MKNSNKRSVRIIACLLAMVMVIGCSFAFFTDFASINNNGTAGTVDVELDASGINLLDEDGKLILNPGDGRDVNFTVSNKGNKSVDIKTVITLTSSVGMLTDANGQAEYEIYKLGDVEFVDGKGWMPKDGAQPLQIRSISDDGRTIVYKTPIYILNGNEELDDMEREIEPDVATDIDPYFDVSDGGSKAENKYVLVFKGASANAFQASDVTLHVSVDAKQHRNQSGWVEVGDDETEIPGADENQETYNVTYIVGGVDDTTKVIPYLSSSLADDTSKFYAGVNTGVFADPNTAHPDWNGKMYEVTYVSVKTASGETIELDANNRFITPAEDIFVTIEVEARDAVAAVYSSNRTFVGEFDTLEEAFEVAEQTAANDATSTVSTWSLIPRANAAAPVNVYVELLTDCVIDETLVVSSPYTITFTSNQAALNATGKDRFALYTNAYPINITAVSNLIISDIVFSGENPGYEYQTYSSITNDGTATLHNVAIDNMNFTLSTTGDIYLSGNIDFDNSNTYFDGIELKMDFCNNAKPAIYCDEDLQLNATFNVAWQHDGCGYNNCNCRSVDHPLNGTTIIYTSDENMLESFKLTNRSVIEQGINYGTYYYCDGELFICRAPYYTFDDTNNTYTVECFGVPKVDLHTYILADGTPCDANTPGAYELVRIIAAPEEVGTYGYITQDKRHIQILEELIVPDDFTGIIECKNTDTLSKIYINSNVTFDAYNCSALQTITTEDIDNAIVVGPKATQFDLNVICNSSISVLDLADSNITSMSGNAGTSANPSMLTEVKLPKGLITLGAEDNSNGAFEGCTSLTNISIPSGVTLIPRWTFRSCTSLEYVVITSPEIEIGSYAFASAPADFKIYYTGEQGGITTAGAGQYDYHIVYVDSDATLNVANGILNGFKTDKYNVATLDLSSIIYINANSEVESFVGFGANLLANNTKTTHVIFPANYTADKFDINVIKNAPAVKSVTFLADGYADVVDALIKSCDLDSVNFMKDGVEITAYPFAEGVTVDANGMIVGFANATGNFTAPTEEYVKTADGQYVKITGIAANAFAGSSVTSITIPVGIYNIDDNAFAGANSLTTVTVEDSRASDEAKRAAWFASNENIQTINAAVADYIRFDWVESKGGNSYVNTYYVPNNTTQVELHYSIKNNGNKNQVVFGAMNNSNQQAFALFHACGNVNTVSWFKGNAGYAENHGGVYNEIIYIKTEDNTLNWLDSVGPLTINNPDATVFTAPCNLIIGALNKANYVKEGCIAKFYDFKIWDNGELKRDYVPAMKDGKIGLYDRTSGYLDEAQGDGFNVGNIIHNTDAEMQSFTRP